MKSQEEIRNKGGRPRINKEKQRNKRVYVYFSAEELKKLMKIAGNVPLSEYIREQLLLKNDLLKNDTLINLEIKGRRNESRWIIQSIELAKKYGYNGKGRFEKNSNAYSFWKEWTHSQIKIDLRAFKIKYNLLENGFLKCIKCGKEIRDIHNDVQLHHYNSARYYPQSIAKIDNVDIFCKTCNLNTLFKI